MSEILSNGNSGGGAPAAIVSQAPLDFQPTARELAYRDWLLTSPLTSPTYKDFASWVNSRILIDGFEIPISQVSGFNQFVNKLVDVDVFMTPIAHTNWSTPVINTGAVWNAQMQSSGAQNDEINFDVGLSAGTWDFELMHIRGSNRGIYTVTLGDISVGTIDGYNATPVENVRTSLTGVTVPTVGVYRLKLKMATKNGSASNHFGVIQHIQLRRTS